MNAFKLTVIVLATTLLAVGCSKSSSNAVVTNNVGTTPVVPPVIVDPPTGTGTGGTNVTFTNGSTVAFTPTSLEVMNEYVATHPLNNPSNFKINVNLSQVQNGRYGGNVSISYTDNGQSYSGVFKSGLGTNQNFKGMYDNNRLESDYNYWFRFNNQLIFSGFFEDQYGAITVTLVPESGTPTSGNDGEPVATAKYKGYVYFKNFKVTTAPHSPYRSCWFTYMGPYDCRSNVIQTKCELFPGAEAGYKLLGTFDAIDNRSAFNLSQ